MRQAPDTGPAGPPRLGREMLVLLGGLIATAHATNMMVVPSLPDFVELLGGAFVVIGLALGVASTARFLTNIPAGIMADRFGRRKVLLAGVIGVGAFASLTGLATDVTTFLVLRFLTGACSAMTITVGNATATDLTTVENRGRTLGLLHGIQLISGLAAPSLGGLLAATIDIRAPFLASGIGALVFGAWAIVRLPETRPHDEGVASAHEAARTEQPTRRDMLRNVSFLMVCLLGYATFFTRTGGTLALMPLFADEVFDIGPGYMGLMFSISSGLHSALVYPAGAVADRLGRKAVIVPTGVLAAIAFAAMPFAETSLQFVVVFFLLHAIVGFGGQAPVAYLGDIAPAKARGLAFGMYRTAGDFAGVIAPVATTALAEGVSFHAAFWLNAAVWTFALLMFARFARETAGRRRAAVSAQR